MSRNPFDDPIQGDMIHYGGFGTLMVEGPAEHKGWGPAVKFLIVTDDGRRVLRNPRIWSLSSWKGLERNGAVVIHQAGPQAMEGECPTSG